MANNRVIPWKNSKLDAIKVLVIGDPMLDEYIDGEVNRISPEAPIPIHLVKKINWIAGGAANVARNVQLLGGEAALVGVWGKDDSGSILRGILSQDGIDISNMITVTGRSTVKKTRITSNRNQLLRIDWEKAAPIEEESFKILYDRIVTQSKDIILISDYGKGNLTAPFLQKIMEHAQKEAVPVVIDPKGADYSSYSGAFLITPNRKEACYALNLDPSDRIGPEELALRLQQKYRLKNILITLGDKGMFFWPDRDSDERQKYLNAISRDVFDVSGAGDTVIAVMALAIGSGLTVAEGMEYANLAGGLVVEKWGTQALREDELVRALEKSGQKSKARFSHTTKKIIDPFDLKNIIGSISNRKEKVVFTNGCFDILHAGHVAYLEDARAQGDMLVVAVNSDASCRKLKGESRPIISLDQRMRLLSALSCVDYVVFFDALTPEGMIDLLVPDVLVKGADWDMEKIIGANTVIEAGGQVYRSNYVDGLSTSNIVRKVRGEMEF